MPVTLQELERIHAYWQASNYLSAGQIYLQANPLLEEPLAREHIKPRLLGHWGTSPGINFIYVHLNRLIRAHDLDMIYIAGPGHGGPAFVAQTYLEGSWSERYPEVGQDREGLLRLLRQFSWPYGVPSHAAPTTPGSIHEGGELGYSLAHAFGAAFDNPGLIVSCIVGDGEAETGALAASWHSNKFLNPARDGTVLPILHLNGYKIANPAVLARIGRTDLRQLMQGYGYEPHFVEGSEPMAMHRAMADTLDAVFARIQAIRSAAKLGARTLPRWPLIVLATPKGWGCPQTVDGKPVEGTWRAHQIPLKDFDNPEHLSLLEQWLQGYAPETLFDAGGRLRAELAALAPEGERRMGANPHANGGTLLVPLDLPPLADHACAVPAPGTVEAESTGVLAGYLREVMRRNPLNFRLFGPDETASNRLDAVYQVSPKAWMAELDRNDVDLSPDGRVMEVLSEHLCQGWLEGYLLTGRHGLFSCYEAFVHIVDSMFNQYAKWLKTAADVPWRAPVASLNYLLTSHLWRQDHNGDSHQDPGFLDVVANKKAGIVRIYLPPDANCLLAVAEHCFNSRNYVNLIVAGKQPEWQWLDLAAATRHCAQGLGIWEWAGCGGDPDVVMACAGDVPTLETLAAVSLLREEVPGIGIRVINVVDLMALQPPGQHPHGVTDEAFEALFTPDLPVIFAFHGYPGLVHRLLYRRPNHASFHVHGYQEEGSTTTPFDMVVLNHLDRYRLAFDAVRRIPRFADRIEAVGERYRHALQRHRQYVREHGEDLPEVRDWRWQA